MVWEVPFTIRERSYGLLKGFKPIDFLLIGPIIFYVEVIKVYKLCSSL